MAPNIAVRAVEKFKKIALDLLNPPYIRTPKSPISCGISWKTTANVVATPRGMLAK